MYPPVAVIGVVMWYETIWRLHKGRDGKET
jgi:hypothetical protein